MNGLTQQELETTIRVVDQALGSMWTQYEALQRLAAHYPEAHHVLSSPRKPDAMVILERLRHWLSDPDRQPAPPATAGDERA